MQDDTTVTEQENKVERLPSLDQAEARFKKELSTLSKRELVRQAANYYMRLTLAGFKIADLEKKLNAQTEQKSEN
jgi:hypothetical protein